MTTLVHVGLSNVLMAAVLAVLAAVVGRCWRRPALSHALWLLVLVKLITPPLVVVPMPWPEPTEEKAAVPAHPKIPPPVEQPIPPVPPVPALAENPLPENMPDIPGRFPEPGKVAEVPRVEKESPPLAPAELPAGEVPVLPQGMNEPDQVAISSFPWPLVLGALWLTGSLVWFSVAMRRVVQFHRLLRHGRRAPEELQAQTRALADRLKVGCPELWLVPGTVAPMVWGLGRWQRLVLPEWLLAALTEDKRAGLLVHELAHLRRRDHWVRWLELIVLGLYWWCPLVWWARRELREAEEECCDAWVLWALPGSARAYAHALVDTVDFLSEAQPALHPVASGFGPVHFLRRRLTMILRGQTPRALTWVGVLGVVAVAALLLPMVPTWAQPPGSGAEQQEPKGPPPGKGREELEKHKQRLQKMAEEIERARADLERKTQALHEEMRRLKQAEAEHAKHGPGPGEGPGQKPGDKFKPFGPGHGPQDIDRRLRDIEHKLDMLLHAVQQLHQRPFPMPKGFGGPPDRKPFDPKNPFVPKGKDRPFDPKGPAPGPGQFHPGADPAQPGFPGGFPPPGGPGRPPNPLGGLDAFPPPGGQPPRDRDK